MQWLTTYSRAAARTDRFRDRTDHLLLLATGLYGEAGSILAEIKKMQREATAYPGYRKRVLEEFGDFLWYYVRIAALADPRIFRSLSAPAGRTRSRQRSLTAALDLGANVGHLLRLVQDSRGYELSDGIRAVWIALVATADVAGVKLEEASRANLSKIQSRWPSRKVFHPLFDSTGLIEEQLPRSTTIEFLERRRGNRVEVLLRCNGIGVGDRITDNIQGSDGYRYHDVFHIAYAVFLGWSPVIRALLRCKRKSDPAADENQDGARATILEEAIAAIVFSRAKEMHFFKGATQVDYDLLKSIQEFIRGYEVEKVALWQWEVAILEGYRVFRMLGANHGGRISWDLRRRTLIYSPVNGSLESRCLG